jgi:D-glycero-D-manno-heptose 1,7-bisphosphate phosphatase
LADLRPAVFLDRDGTLVHDPGFLHDPALVRLLPGAAASVARLNHAGWPVVLVTNQSGIARGLYGAADYHAVRRRLAELLSTAGARLDAEYFCPHHPDVTGPCECRKPGVLLFQTAAADHGLALEHSVWVGDRLSDVEPARRLGGRAFLVRTGEGARHVEQARVLAIPVVDDLAQAVDRILDSP